MRIITESTPMFKSFQKNGFYTEFPIHTILSISFMRFSMRFGETGIGVFSS
jgi:hypothetical protein